MNRNFNYLGNCVYDKQFVSALRGGKIKPQSLKHLNLPQKRAKSDESSSDLPQKRAKSDESSSEKTVNVSSSNHSNKPNRTSERPAKVALIYIYI